jgi:CheY-like chemotaxis protein
MEQMVARLVGEHVRVEVHPAGVLLPVEADPVQMEQLIMNLASNAADAMPGGGTLSLETATVILDSSLEAQREVIPPGSYVRLTVRDDGSGMSPEIQGHVFEPFYTTKAAGKGTGLGLATVYGIVKQSNGFISLESAPGKGATFRIYFPTREGTIAAAPVEREQGTAPGGRETILVVDDQEEVRAVTMLMLEDLGYTVVEASSGQEALAILDRGSPPVDLVITDVSMPEMTGHALVERISVRANPPKSLFISGYADGTLDGLVHNRDFVQKPFTARTLAQAVRTVLDGTPV